MTRAPRPERYFFGIVLPRPWSMVIIWASRCSAFSVRANVVSRSNRGTRQPNYRIGSTADVVRRKTTQRSCTMGACEASAGRAAAVDVHQRMCGVTGGVQTNRVTRTWLVSSHRR